MKQTPAAHAIELLDLVEQLTDAVWLPKEVIDRAVPNIRGELTPEETGRPTRQKWLRDRVRVVQGRGRVVDRQRERR